jgi:protein ImuA
LHEVVAASTDMGGDAAASLFAAGIAARAAPSSPGLWVLSRADLFAPGLAQVGLGPSRLLQVDARTDEDALAIMEDGLRHGGFSVVVCEIATKADLRATRRLQLAAEEGATTALMLRRWKRSKADPLASNSTAMIRWRIRFAPSTPLPVAGVGRARWHVELVRQRGGDSYQWLLEGCDATGRLALPAEPRHGSAALARERDGQAA